MEPYELLIQYLKIIDMEIFPGNPIKDILMLANESSDSQIMGDVAAAFMIVDDSEQCYFLKKSIIANIKQNAKVPLVTFINPDVDFRKNKENHYVPFAADELLLAGIAAHECRHRFQFLNGGSAVVDSYDYRAASGPFFHIANFVLNEVKQGGYSESKYDLEVDARVIEQVFMRELYKQTRVYNKDVLTALKASASIVTYDLGQIKELLNSCCWLNNI